MVRQVVRSILIEVILRNKASAELRNASRTADEYKSSMSGAAGAANDVETASDTAAESLEHQTEASENAKQRTDNLRQSLLALGAAFTAVGAAGYLYFNSATKAFASYDNAYNIFVRNNGQASSQLLDDMEAASRGAISHSNLVMSANRAVAMGIEAETLPRLAEIADAAGRLMNESTDKMFDDIVRGIARGSPLILDNLGIIISVSEANEEYAKSLGKSASALTDEEQKLALLYATMDKGQRLIDMAGPAQNDLAVASARAAVAVENMNIAMGRSAEGSMKSWYDMVVGAANMVSKIPEPVLAVVGVIGMAGTAVSSVIGPLMLQAAAILYLRQSWGHLHLTMIKIPAISALTTGGLAKLTAVLYMAAAGSWAFLAPWLPLIAAVAGVIAVIWLLWDVANNGWDDSVLGKSLTWLKNAILPGLTVNFEVLTGAVRSFISWLQNIPKWIENTWSAIRNHPLWPVIETLLRFSNPVGIGITAAQTLTGDYDPSAQFSKLLPQTSSQITIAPVINSTMNIDAPNLDRKEMEGIVKDQSQKNSDNVVMQLNKSILSQL